MKAATVTLTILLVVSLISMISMITGTNVWLAAWSTDQNILNSTYAKSQIKFRLTIYGIFGIGQGNLISPNTSFIIINISKNYVYQSYQFSEYLYQLLLVA